MPQCVVVADDLTGANATGVLLKKMNYKTITVMNAERLELSSLSDYDCVMYPTDSRSVSKEIAYNRIYNVMNLLRSKEIKVYSKRIDSTLRGNLGSETDAALDCLGEEYVAIVAPCFPASGRIVIGGYMLVNGLPLHKTEVALDPKTPVKTSEVKALFEKQTRYQVASVNMNEMMNGEHHLAELMQTLVKQGNRILTFDCVTQEDLDLIADALIASKLKFLATDPGVFTATIARKLIKPADKQDRKKILAVVGSVNPVARAQMEELWLTQGTVHNTFIKTKELLEGEEQRNNEIQKVIANVQRHSKDYDILTVTGDGIFPENRIDFAEYSSRYQCRTEDLSKMINQAFAEITYQLFKQNAVFQGLYTSGGDITVSVCEKFQTVGLALQDEVLPLAAYGIFLKGEFDGVHIITKGGMVGESNAVNRCITYLKEKLYM